MIQAWLRSPSLCENRLTSCVARIRMESRANDAWHYLVALSDDKSERNIGALMRGAGQRGARGGSERFRSGALRSASAGLSRGRSESALLRVL